MRPVERLTGRLRLRRLGGARTGARRRLLIEQSSRAALERNWDAAGGFTRPNRRRYPWQWLWDSCFHAIAWSALGDSRCVQELESLFALQLPSGFLPHMGYGRDPGAALALWHSPGRSDITQPPMYGHALRVLDSRGFGVEHLCAPATAALRHLFNARRDHESGLIRIVHPWESGCDDSPRWDGWDSRPFSERRWKRRKRDLLATLGLADGAAATNPQFEVASAGFNALVAFNARELGLLTGERELLAQADALASALDRRWVAELGTWSDLQLRGPRGEGTVRTLDALFGVLATGEERRRQDAFAVLFAPAAFWRSFGPSGTATGEPTYDPRAYWRGDAWPQEIYLLMVAARRCGREQAASQLAQQLVRGCVRSCFSERWNPESGDALGATPQGWAALAAEAARVLHPAE